MKKALMLFILLSLILITGNLASAGEPIKLETYDYMKKKGLKKIAIITAAEGLS